MEKAIKDFAGLIYNLSAFEFTLTGTIIGYLLAIPLTTDEQNSLGNLFEIIGQTLLTFNAQNVLLHDKMLKNNNMTNEDLSRRIEMLESKLDFLLNKLK